MEFYCMTITVLMLVLVRLCDSQQLSYMVSIQFRDANNITMMCQNNNGQLVSDAVFYRNGAPYSKDAECLQAISRSPPNNGLLSVVLTARCEGYYQCGVHMTPNAILSGPITLNAYPVLTVPLDSNIEIEVTVGENATAYCPFEVSALDSFMVVWKRLLNGVLTVISDSNTPLNEDYSIVTPNVTFGNKGVYFCTVTSVPFQNMIGGRANGPSNTFIVRRKHVPPMFTTALTFRKNTEDNYIFLINSKGTDPLLFRWFMNNNVIDSQEIEVTPTDINQVVEKMSRVVVDIENIGAINGGEDILNLTVVVFNTDMDQLFTTSHTSFVFLHEEEMTADITIGMEESDKLWDMIVMYLLVFLLFVSWLLIIVLIVIVGYMRQLNKPGRSQHVKQNTQCPSQMESTEYRNPVSFILYGVANMYGNVKLSDYTPVKSLHQVLIEVLDDNVVSSQPETMEYVEALRNGVGEFKDRLRKNHKDEPDGYFSEDEPDGYFSEDEQVPEIFNHMKRIENVLTGWIDKKNSEDPPPYVANEF